MTRNKTITEVASMGEPNLRGFGVAGKTRRLVAVVARRGCRDDRAIA